MGASHENFGVVVDAVSELFGVETILQIDFIDADCSCVASFANTPYFYRDASHNMDASLRGNEDSANTAPYEEHNKVEIDHSGHTHSDGVDSRLMGDFHTNPTNVNYMLTHVSYEGLYDTGSTGERPGFLAIDSWSADSGWQPDVRQISLLGDEPDNETYLVAEIFHRLERGND